MTRHGVLTRIVLLVLAQVALLGIAAPPAFAHGRGSDATNFSSRITDTADLPGVTWKIYNGDEFLGVENTSGTELVIPGYNGDELYLRIGPDGVFVNRKAEAYYINQDRYGQTRVPANVGTGEPQWVKVSDEPRYAWHDHRIHWMSPVLPPPVRNATELTEVFNWTVPFRYGGQELQIAGELLWVPGPSPWVWLLAALPIVAIPALVGLRTKPQGRTWPGLVRPAAVVLGTIAVANLIHLVDDFFSTPVPLTQSALVAVQTLLFIGIGLFGAIRAWQAGNGAFTALGTGSVALFVGQGLLYFSVLGSSQAASIFPGTLTRAIVAASLVQIVPLAFVAVWGNRHVLDAPESQSDFEPIAT